MKTYENLSKAEREKLSLFLQYVAIEKNYGVTVIAGAFVFIAIGIPLFLLTPYIWVMLSGVMCFVYGLILMMVALGQLLRIEKKLFLVFGYTNNFKEVFGITQSDVLKVKKVTETKMKKVN